MRCASPTDAAYQGWCEGQHRTIHEMEDWLNRERQARHAAEAELLDIPWMVAFALRADGWYLRSEIVWGETGGVLP